MRDPDLERGGTWSCDERLSIDHGRRLASQAFTARQAICFTFSGRTCRVHGPAADEASIRTLIEETRKS